MAKYTKEEILDLYEGKENGQLKEAETKLKELKVYCGDKIKINELNGWVFEQVVQFCLIEELGKNNLLPIKEQHRFEYWVSESDRKKLKIFDLFINNKILIEVKVNGHQMSKWDDKTIDEKYVAIRKRAEEIEYNFLYISIKEANPKKTGSKDYRKRTRDLLGEENCFFLDETEDNWQKFVKRVSEILKQRNNS